MKKIFYNAKVYLCRGEFAEAVLVNGSEIEAVGTSASLLDLAPEAEAIDCGGRTIIPGFNDSHCHLLSLGA